MTNLFCIEKTRRLGSKLWFYLVLIIIVSDALTVEHYLKTVVRVLSLIVDSSSCD